MPPVHGNPVFKTREVFQCLDDARSPTGALGFSVGLHVSLLLLLILLPLLFPQALHLNYRAILLEPPPPPSLDIQPVKMILPPKVSMPKLVRLPEPVERPIAIPTAVAPAPAAPPIPPAPPPPLAAPRIIEALPKPNPLVPSIPPVPVDARPSVPTAPQPPVITNVFSGTATSAEKTGGTKVPSAVGGFDRSGVAGGSRTVNGGSAGSTALGAFDRSGASSGTRTGSEVGARAPVAAAGFLSSLDVPKTAVANSNKTQLTPIEKPVEILQKPKPDYTDEARKSRIEGEVLLRVLFTSSGELQVVDVVRGLGYGLNENAIRAAKQIRFKPAERDGRPIDSTAIVHIVFQLAY